MSLHNICRGFHVSVVKKESKYHIDGLFYKNVKLLENWESLAQVALLTSMFAQRELPKQYQYSIESITFEHVEKSKVHFLKLSIGDEIMFLDTVEVKLFPAILNRVISRCDVLYRNSYMDSESDEFAEFKIFNEYPIVVNQLTLV